MCETEASRSKRIRESEKEERTARKRFENLRKRSEPFEWDSGI